MSRNSGKSQLIWLRVMTGLIFGALVMTWIDGQKSNSPVSAGLSASAIGISMLALTWRGIRKWYDAVLLAPGVLLTVAGFGTIFGAVDIDVLETLIVRATPIVIVTAILILKETMPGSQSASMQSKDGQSPDASTV